jgi:hypothetical protein
MAEVLVFAVAPICCYPGMECPRPAGVGICCYRRPNESMSTYNAFQSTSLGNVAVNSDIKSQGLVRVTMCRIWSLFCRALIKTNARTVPPPACLSDCRTGISQVKSSESTYAEHRTQHAAIASIAFVLLRSYVRVPGAVRHTTLPFIKMYWFFE